MTDGIASAESSLRAGATQSIIQVCTYLGGCPLATLEVVLFTARRRCLFLWCAVKPDGWGTGGTFKLTKVPSGTSPGAGTTLTDTTDYDSPVQYSTVTPTITASGADLIFDVGDSLMFESTTAITTGIHNAQVSAEFLPLPSVRAWEQYV